MERIERSPRAVAVATLTYQRPALVAELIPSLVQQLASVAAPGARTLIVVDNDPAASARSVVADVIAKAGPDDVDVRYVHEPEPGISAARNRALVEAGDTGFLAFIDDDERPSADWLPALVEVAGSYGATAVLGPVLPEYAQDPDPWILAGGFFDRPRRETGTPLEVGFCGNILLDMEFVTVHQLRFDPAFGLSGGEDTLFTMELSRAGGTMVWCDEAPVTDLVPASRLNRAWVLKRRFSAGNTTVLSALAIADTWGERAWLRTRFLVGGIARAGVGAGRYLAGSIMRSPRHQARGLRTAYRGLGLLSGVTGYRYLEYRR